MGLGVINFFVAVLNFEALKQGKLSVIDLILAVELPLTILFGLVFFRESLSVFQSLIIAVIFFGIILTSISSFSKKILKNLEKGVLIALATAIGMALVNFLTAAGSKTISPLMAIWVPWLVFTAVSLFYLWRKNKLKNFVENGFKHKKLVFLTGFFDTFAWVFFAMAVFQNPLSITTAITEAFPIVAMFLGFFVNKEKIFGHQLLGATLTLA
ncbi:MAG: EamA family transporter [Candidatus Diapherotrites archaeon]|nr:EamA family transporter [Candidatus Diapherotrites archaeon]